MEASTYIHRLTYIHTCIHTHTERAACSTASPYHPRRVHGSKYIHTQINIHTYMHTYIYIYNIHTYIHTYTYREGCVLNSITISSEARTWKQAVVEGLRVVRRLDKFGITQSELDLLLKTLMGDYRQEAEQAEVCMYVYVCVCIYIYMFVCVCVYIHTHLWAITDKKQSKLRYVCMYMCVCIHIYIYIYTCIHASSISTYSVITSMLHISLHSASFRTTASW